MYRFYIKDNITVMCNKVENELYRLRPTEMKTNKQTNHAYSRLSTADHVTSSHYHNVTRLLSLLWD
jgi:hypothetical protein